MKKSEEEQNIFLSICSAYDRAVLTGKEEMKKEDFERKPVCVPCLIITEMFTLPLIWN